MSLKHKLGLRFGMEDVAPNVQVNIDTDEGGMPLDDVAVTEDGELEPTPEADAAEIAQQAEEIEADGDDLDDLEVASESLFLLYAGMESAQRNGGLTPEAAIFANISAESIMANLKIDGEDAGVASLESFEYNKAKATTVSMEGVMDALKNIWETIVEKFKEMAKKVVDFYEKTIAAAPRIKNRAISLKKKADKTTGSQKDSQIKTGLFGLLNIKGKVPSASEILKCLKETELQFRVNVDKKDVEADIAAIFSKESMIAGNFDVTEFSTILGASLAVISGWCGNRKMVVGVKTESGAEQPQTFHALASAYKYNLVEDNEGVKNDKDARAMEFDVLDLSEISSICTQVVSNMEAIIRIKTQATRPINVTKTLEKKGEQVIAKYSKEAGTNEGEARKFLTSIATISRTMQTGQANLLRYNYTTSKAALAYCARSLANYRA